jgi:hypothetical protein
MEYKRLTDEEFIKAVETCDMACVYGEKCIECVYFEHDNCAETIQGKLKKAIQYLAELENKIEQGTLIELPCKVGDTIWVVDESWGHREDGTWGSTSEMHEGKVYSFTYYGNCLHVEDDFTSNVYLWGEDAFLTREEAEKRLKELQNG